MTIQTVAAPILQRQLDFIVLNATGEGVHVRKWFLARCTRWNTMRIVGTPSQLRELRRELVKDAVGLGARRDHPVRALVRKIARDGHYVAPRVASISGCSAGHRFGLRMPRKN